MIIIYHSYDYLALYLNQAINNHSIGFLEGFDLKSKLHDKCGFDAIPSSAELQTRFLLFYKIFLFWVGFTLLLFFAPWKKWKQYNKTPLLPKIHMPRTIKIDPQHRISTIILLISILTLYLFWHWIISLAGLLGDDYYCGMTQGKSFITRIAWWIWCYATHVSRIGESIYYIFPQTIERTQHLLITPLFVALFPFVIKRLNFTNFKMNSWKGILYYWTMGILSFMGIIIIRILIIYAPCCNYFYPVIICLLFYSFYLKYSGIRHTKNRSIITIILFFLLGILSGWATEGMAVIGISLLGIWLLYWTSKEKNIAPMYYWGLVGYFIGACNVIFSTGPSIRGALYPRLTGGNIPYNLTVLPLWERFTYLPELYKALWDCINVPTYLIILSIAIIYIFRLQHHFNKKFWIIFIGYVITAILLATVYIVGAVPNGSTFTPSSYVMVAAFGLIFAKLLDSNWKFSLIPFLVITIFTISYMVPRIKLAIITSKYDKLRIETIKSQKDSGQRNIELHYPLPFEYKADRTYIPFQHFSSDPQQNKHQASFFGVQTIREADWKENGTQLFNNHSISK